MKHAPERPIVIVKDTREPDEAAGDHPDSVFRPCVFPSGISRSTPYADRPRAAVPVERRKLDVGDYSLPGLEGVVALERKSGPDLLATLFGESGNDALGHARHNIDRFRAELERARGMSLFAIVVETDEAGLFREADRRWKAYGKSFDPEAVIALLRSFAIDLGVATVWCSPVTVEEEIDCPACAGGERVCECGRRPCEKCGGTGLLVRRRLIFSGKQRAELQVGMTLARVWSQATGGAKARDARRRGYGFAWLGVLEEPIGPDNYAPHAPVAPCSWCEGSGEPCACNAPKVTDAA